MPHPKKMTDEQLAPNGFTIRPDNPNVARNGVSTRYRCADCGIWTNQAMGHKGDLICLQCNRRRFKSGQ